MLRSSPSPPTRSAPTEFRNLRFLEIIDNVDAGDAQQHSAHRLTGFPWRGRRLGQEQTAAGEVGGTAAVGEQPEVADTDEAIGDDVEEKPAEESGT